MKFTTIGALIAGAIITWSAPSAHAATIDLMTLNTFGGYTQRYDPDSSFDTEILVLPTPDEYFLSDGTSWESGAGSFRSYVAGAPSVERTDGMLHYTFDLPFDGIVLDYTDYNSGDHSSQGVLSAVAPLVLVAEEGASTGIIRGYLEITSNEETRYGEPRFNYYSADVGDLVYFELTFVLYGALFDESVFEGAFDYGVSGFVDFTADGAVPLPAAAPLMLFGLALARTARVARRTS